MFKKLYISLIFSNLVVSKTLSTIIISMHNFIAKFREILDICKH
ncbi:MAG: IS982 family transposase, partial [Bacteroidaceae bacterium]